MSAASTPTSATSHVTPGSPHLSKRKSKKIKAGIRLDIQSALEQRVASTLFSPGILVTPAGRQAGEAQGVATWYGDAASTPAVSVSSVPNRLLPQGVEPMYVHGQQQVQTQQSQVQVQQSEKKDVSGAGDDDDDVHGWTSEEESMESLEFAEERLKSRVREMQNIQFECDKNAAVLKTVFDMRSAEYAQLEKRLQAVMAKSAETVKDVERVENVTSMLQYQLQVSEEKLLEVDELIDTYVQTIDELTQNVAAQRARWFYPMFARMYAVWAFLAMMLPARENKSE